MAALLTTISTRSNSLRNSSNASATLSGSLTSAWMAMAFRPMAADLIADVLRFLVAVVVDDRDIATRAGQLECCGTADPAGSPRDERDFSFNGLTHLI